MASYAYELIFVAKMLPSKKDPYPLPFIDEVLDNVVGHEIYKFFEWLFRLSLYLHCFRGLLQDDIHN